MATKKTKPTKKTKKSAKKSADVSEAIAIEHGVSADEFGLLQDRLGRLPTHAELAVFSVMWSEKHSLKSSRVHLAKLPRTGPYVLDEFGQNAGVVDIGNDWAAIFKIGAYTHESFIDPRGAEATGVAGILGDVASTGAPPLARLDSLRFGGATQHKTRQLASGIVSGLASYANSTGVPVLGGEITFDECYNGNLLINLFNLGVCRHGELFRAVADGAENPVIYAGLMPEEGEKPAEQLAPPTGANRLLEAVKELLLTGAVTGIQPMEATGGLTTSCVELAHRGQSGITIDIDSLPLWRAGMTAHDCLLAESRECFLVVAEAGREKEVYDTFEKFGLEFAAIGRVTAANSLVIKESGNVACDLPIALIKTDAPAKEWPAARPKYVEHLQPVELDDLPRDLAENVLDLVGSPNVSNRRPILDPSEHTADPGTPAQRGGDASVIAVPGTDRVIAITVDCNSRYCYLNPRLGAQLAAAECARNISCTGATPAAVTHCLNFGSPENPESMWQFVEAVEGLSEACNKLGTPVVSGSVNLGNESGGLAIYPTPTLGMVGVFDRPPRKRIGIGFQKVNDRVVLLGETFPELGGSELAHLNGYLGGTPPRLEWRRELGVQTLVRNLIRRGSLRSAHDLSEGGLAVALSECALHSAKGSLGIDLDYQPTIGRAAWLFSESASRVLVSTSLDQLSVVLDAAVQAGVPAAVIGAVKPDHLTWSGHFSVSIDALRQRYDAGLDGII